MDMAHARSLVPAAARLHVEEHKPERDAAALERLACWALRYSPVVALDAPDGLLLDATGLERHYAGRGEAGLAQALGTALCRLGVAPRIAVASTYAAARAVARYGRECLTHVPPGGDRAVLAALPARALCDDAATQTAFDELGLTRVAHVLDLPRAALAAQFGDELLRSVDRMLGLAAEVIEPVRADPSPRAEILFDGSSDRWEALEAAAGDVLDAVVAMLIARGQAVQQLDLEVRRPAGRPRETYAVRLSRPSGSRRHVWAMLRGVLERIDTSAGIEGVSLTASVVQRVVGRQAALALAGAAQELEGQAAWGELLDTLIGNLGGDNVVCFEPLESHLPERAFRACDGLQRSGANIAGIERPTRLFDPPVEATVVLQAPDGPLLHIAWSGQRRNVVACRGPERIAAEWWRGSPPAEDRPIVAADRDYFAVQTDDGAWLWACRRSETGRWFVHGDWA
jgi:protein ImuB